MGCARSLMWRSKPSQSQTWLRRWKRVAWMRHLSIRTCMPSHSTSFTAAWTSSLAASRASRSARQASGWLKKIPGICGRPSLEESQPAAQASFSWRTSRESSQPNQPKGMRFSTMCLSSWKAWATEQRREYSARKNAALHTAGEGSSSQHFATPTVTQNQLSPAMMKHPGCRALAGWPTPTGIHATRGNHDEPLENYQKRVQDYEQGRAKGKPGKSLGIAVRQWPTVTSRDWKDTPGMSTARKDRPGDARGSDQLPRAVYTDGRQQQGSPSTNGNRRVLSARWVETLMGLPQKWTELIDCGSWGTESCLRLPQGLSLC